MRHSTLLAALLALVLPAGTPALLGAQESPPSDDRSIPSRYVSPFYGFVVDWDEAVWTLEGIEQYEPDGNEIWLEHERSFVTIAARERFDGDPAACLERYDERLRADEDNVKIEQTTEPEALPVERDPAGRASLYTYTSILPSGHRDQRAEYIECRPLVAGEAVLEVELHAPAEAYRDVVAPFEDLLAASRLEAGAGEDIEAPVWDAYVGPDFGIALTWDPDDWSLLEWDNILGYSSNSVTLGSEAGDIWVAAYERYDGDPETCLEDDLDYMESWDVLELEVARDSPRIPEARDPDAAAALYTITFEPEEVGAEPEPPMIRYFECRTLEPGTSVLWIDLRVWDEDDYAELLPEVEELMENIEA